MDIERSVVFIQFLGVYFGIMLIVMVVIVLPALIWCDIIPKPKFFRKKK